MSLLQNSVSLAASSGKSSLKPTFSIKSKEAVAKTEVLQQPLLAVTFHLPGGLNKKNIMIIFGGVGIVFILAVLAFFPLNPLSMANRSAVLLKTEGYRVPDSAGAVNTIFMEGQPVKIRSSPPSWSFVETIDGRQGWVPAESVIPY